VPSAVGVSDGRVKASPKITRPCRGRHTWHQGQALRQLVASAGSPPPRTDAKASQERASEDHRKPAWRARNGNKPAGQRINLSDNEKTVTKHFGNNRPTVVVGPFFCCTFTARENVRDSTGQIPLPPSAPTWSSAPGSSAKGTASCDRGGLYLKKPWQPNQNDLKHVLTQN
jgi:hypothetical protein